MSSTIKQLLLYAAKSHVETQISVCNTLNRKAVSGIANLIDLNLNVMKASMKEVSAKANILASSKNALEFVFLAAAQAQPNMKKFIAYSERAANIASTMRDEFVEVARIDFAETNKQITAFLENLSEQEANIFNHIMLPKNASQKNVFEEYGHSIKMSGTKHDEPKNKTLKNVAAHHISHSKKSTSSVSKKSNVQ